MRSRSGKQIVWAEKHVLRTNLENPEKVDSIKNKFCFVLEFFFPHHPIPPGGSDHHIAVVARVGAASLMNHGLCASTGETRFIPQRILRSPEPVIMSV